MLNRYPLWKYLLVLIVCMVGIIYALPNLYPQDPAVQISITNGPLGSQQLDRVTQALSDSDIQVKSAVMTGNNTALIRLSDAEQQLSARDIVDDVLDNDYTVALNLADSIPSWLTSFSARPMKLGLDLRGGVHFLLEVDMKAALEQRLEATASAIRATLRDQRIRYRSTHVDDNTLHLEFANTEDRDAARNQTSQIFNEFQLKNRDKGRRAFLDMTLTEQSIKDIQDYVVQQNLATIRNRVNELGVSEPLVQRQGPSSIVVELPGVQDTAEAKRIVGATANLEFRLEARPDAADSETETFSFRNNPQRTTILSRDVIITGDRVSSASQSFDQNGRPQVNINLDGIGGSLMNQATRTNIGRNIAVLYIDHSTETLPVVRDGKQVEERIPTINRSIISLATVQSALSNRFRITGLDSPTEAGELGLLLRSGSLVAPIYFVQERIIGPSLGAQNIERGIFSVVAGGLLVVAFMLIRYKAFGVIANAALAINLVLLIAAMSLLGATLTLPGIAGIVLTLGMAVDTNVLIYERIREELRRKAPPQQAIHAGYGRAFTSIIDANLTTLLVAVVLFSIGAGPIKGFAVTLSLGILTSMFTGILVSRALVNLSIGGKLVKKLWIQETRAMRQFDFMGKRRIAFTVSIALTIMSVAALATLHLNLSLDFTGGTVVELHYAAAPPLDDIRTLLANCGFKNFQVQTFGATDDILVRLQQAFDNNIGNQIVSALSSDGAQIDLIRAEFVGAQIGDQLRDQSGLGMLAALASVAVYVAFRFQYKFALGAIVSLGQDVLIVLGLFALFQWEFDLTVLAGIMAVIGYSLNDTIIVYDRIRESIRLSRSDSLTQIFNEAINQTLSRTLATSGTTLLVLFALFFLGGDMIHNFSISLVLGIVAGTFSSIYVSTALLIVFKLERQNLISVKKEEVEEKLP